MLEVESFVASPARVEICFEYDVRDVNSLATEAFRCGQSIHLHDLVVGLKLSLHPIIPRLTRIVREVVHADKIRLVWNFHLLTRHLVSNINTIGVLDGRKADSSGIGAA